MNSIEVTSALAVQEMVTVAIAQINCTVGDLSGNAQRILASAAQAAAQGANILLTPELSLVGYPAEDLLLRAEFYLKSAQILTELAERLAIFPNLYVLVGHPLQQGDLRYNAASVLRDGKIIATYCKHELPNYDVFDERRYFSSGTQALVFDVKGTRFGVNICEDTWFGHAPQMARARGAQVLLVLNASPYHLAKQQQRLEVMRANVSAAGLALVSCNLVGGQDELVFDGASFVLDQAGALTAQLPQFTEHLATVIFVAATPQQQLLPTAMAIEEQVYRALVLGTQDYLSKNRFSGAIIGLSGGVDSALTLAIAVDALGAERVRAVMMPSAYTAEISYLDAREMAGRLGVQYDEIAISSLVEQFARALESQFIGLAPDASEENIQARIRGTLLMALSNKTGRIVLTTGNKSEMATGYCTLYGDMAGGFAVLKDICKTLVYRLCDYRNQISAVIPQRILTRAPSAELRPNQTDQDTLPPYEILDAVLQAYMEQGQGVDQIIALGFAKTDVQRIVDLIQTNEYKRRQAPLGIRVTHRAFGRDWRYPITNRFKEN